MSYLSVWTCTECVSPKARVRQASPYGHLGMSHYIELDSGTRRIYGSQLGLRLSHR